MPREDGGRGAGPAATRDEGVREVGAALPRHAQVLSAPARYTQGVRNLARYVGNDKEGLKMEKKILAGWCPECGKITVVPDCGEEATCGCGHALLHPIVCDGFKEAAAAIELLEGIVDTAYGSDGGDEEDDTEPVCRDRWGRDAEVGDGPYDEAHLLHEDGDGRNEPQGAPIYHGTCRHKDDARLLRARR